MGQFAFIFPGQGSQRLGMLSHMATIFPIVTQTFNEASEIIGVDLWNLIQNGPREKLNKTYLTQPALLASSLAIYRIWKKISPKQPAILAGHSLGEYSALVCAKVLKFSEAIRIVYLRGKLMQKAVPEGTGAMQAIIGLNKQLILNICKKNARGKIVAPVIFNSPNQTVISGHIDAVKRVGIACKNAGAHSLSLPISVPAHCILMQPISHKLAKILNNVNFNSPKIPIINNVDVTLETQPLAIRKALIRQLYSPVRWEETIEFILSKKINLFFEIGPNKILTNLSKYIYNNLTMIAINNPSSLIKAKNKVDNLIWLH